MDNLDRLIEKYKREMLGLSKRSAYDDVSSAVKTVQFEENRKTADEIEERNPLQTVTESSTEVENPVQTVSESSAEKKNSVYYGFLKVAVFAGNEAFPVQTAKVEVFDKEGNMLYSLLTNSGGIAEGMVLETPSESENDEPGGEKGYSVYKVRVSHPDYGTQEFDEVQIFEGIESIQQVFFQPDALSFTDGEDSDG